MDSDTQEFMERVGGEPKRSLHPPSQGRDVPVSSSMIQIHPAGGDCQWAVLPNDTYLPWGSTVTQLPPGVYGCEWRNDILAFAKRNILTDALLKLPDTASDRVLEGIKKFWEARNRFTARGQLFKRGVLLFGPPGGGKTATVTLLMRDLVERGGIVIIAENPEMASTGLRNVRRIEAERPIICVMEDIDEIISRFGESALLSLLDGENQVDNVVHVATTNYPEHLDARLVNRPSRFDEIIKIGMPSRAARFTYLSERTDRDELGGAEIERWVDDTEGMSIAHLRELVIAIYCLGRTYEETLGRLRAMKTRPKGMNEYSIEGFGKRHLAAVGD